MDPVRVLLAGETWVSAASHFKGFDQFGSVTFHSGAGPLLSALAGSRFAVTHLPAHEAVERFPFDAAGLAGFDVVMLSDIGANSLLLPPEVWLHGRTMPNRLRLLADWVAGGGALLMAGGYLSFQGIDGRARWHRTPVEAALPVDCLPHDDRIEVPEGFAPEIAAPGHPVLDGIPPAWPPLLGANEVRARPGAEVVLRLPVEQGGHPLLVLGRHGRGRTAAWTSDIGPHWVPQTFSDWPGYARLWRNLLGWLAGG
jgi:uncharacterized membrane protein